MQDLENKEYVTVLLILDPVSDMLSAFLQTYWTNVIGPFPGEVLIARSLSE